MRYSTIMLSLGLAAVAIMVLGVGPTSAQSTSGTSLYLASTSIGDSVVGNAQLGPFMLVMKGHGFGHRGFRGGLFLGGYPGYGYWGSYPLEYNTSPSTSCVWNGYSYTCYNFPSDTTYREY
ncbi:MAG: hypothetical protein ACLP5H_29630 [Desulfomonilaceae bacterium]